MIFARVLKHANALCRAPIAFFAAYAAMTGFLLAQQRSLADGVRAAVAILILAAGASVLNQYQERHIDARMERTRRRPLPIRVIVPSHALLIALALIAAGLAMLSLSTGKTPLMLGTLAILWYNGVYTYLKRMTAFAAVPGAIVGMIPPAIGWTAGGGSLMDPRIFAVSLLFFIWQVPHFWLQVLHHGEEYEQAGLPSLTRVLDKQQISRISFVWICAAITASLLLPLYGNLTSPLLYGALLFTAVGILLKSVKLVTAQRSPALTLALFRQLNIFILILMSLLSLERTAFWFR